MPGNLHLACMLNVPRNLGKTERFGFYSVRAVKFLSLCRGAVTDLHHASIVEHAQFLEYLVNSITAGTSGLW